MGRSYEAVYFYKSKLISCGSLVKFLACIILLREGTPLVYATTGMVCPLNCTRKYSEKKRIPSGSQKEKKTNDITNNGDLNCAPIFSSSLLLCFKRSLCHKH